MITKMHLKNFKSIKDQVFDFNQFDLLVGRNNCGKSTVLQALAIWQFSIDSFRRESHSGSKGIQIVLPNFTALPVPEFNMLWKDRVDREYPIVEGKRKQDFILIEISVTWKHFDGREYSFGVNLRYHSPQTIYAIPKSGWQTFNKFEEEKIFPIIAYVPPFSGLDPTEKWLDISPIHQQVGKGQPGSVLRNLLLRVCPFVNNRDRDGDQTDKLFPEDWNELASVVERLFSIKIHEPKYDSTKDVYIKVEYTQNDKDYDIIAAGSGLHQTLTLLAFLYGYKPTTILLDEPDAHLHVNLQRELLDYFQKKSIERGIQFLIATHAEEFIKGVDGSQIISMLSHIPKRVTSEPEILRAMAEVSNEEITRLMISQCILYVEGESDERLLRAWARQIDTHDGIMDRIYFKAMNGGTKDLMREAANKHFTALRSIIPDAKRLMLFDYDSPEGFHPTARDVAIFEWKRKNIENYLLVPDVWIRVVIKDYFDGDESNMFAGPVVDAIRNYFAGENLTLPPGKDWKSLDANIFKLVDGKQLLFESENSLFQILRKLNGSIVVKRERLAMEMKNDEIHHDVHEFMVRLINLVKN